MFLIVLKGRTAKGRFTTGLFPLDALDVEDHHWLVVGEAMAGQDGGVDAVHFECPPRTRGRSRRTSRFCRGFGRRRGPGGGKEVAQVFLQEDGLKHARRQSPDKQPAINLPFTGRLQRCSRGAVAYLRVFGQVPVERCVPCERAGGQHGAGRGRGIFGVGMDGLLPVYFFSKLATGSSI